MAEFRPSLAIGLLAALGAALTGVGWQLATRAGVTTNLGPLDLALLRYCVPALLLLPVLIKQGFFPPGGTSPLPVALMIVGSGLPYGLLAMTGAKFAPVAHMGALIPGTMPLFAGILAAVFLGDRWTTARAASFAVIIVGVLLISGHSLADSGAHTLLGDFLFVAAAFFWAAYSVAFRKSGYGAWQATALVVLVSAVMVLPLWLVASDHRLLSVSWSEIAFQTLAQGVFAGVFGSWVYAVSVRHLGPARAALSGALVPALAAAGGYLFLGETLGLLTVGGVLLVIAGVLAATLAAQRK